MILLCIIVPNNVLASSGKLRKDSIVTCNGVTYGKHGTDSVHWHVAEKRDNGWYPQGSAIYYSNPCNKATTTKKTTTTTAKTTTSKKTTIKKVTTKKSTSTATSITTTTTSTVSTTTTTISSTTASTASKVMSTTKKVTSSEITTSNEDSDDEESTSNPVLGTLLLGAGGAYVYNEYKKSKLKK